MRRPSCARPVSWGMASSITCRMWSMSRLVPSIRPTTRRSLTRLRRSTGALPIRSRVTFWWGRADGAVWLGIPVKWPHISNARVIVECGLENYRVDPSQGTHFFQNLTSFGVGYFTINPFKGDGLFDEACLNAMPAVTETEYLRHVHFDHPIVIKMDGKRSLGVVMK